MIPNNLKFTASIDIMEVGLSRAVKIVFFF